LTRLPVIRTSLRVAFCRSERLSETNPRPSRMISDNSSVAPYISHVNCPSKPTCPFDANGGDGMSRIPPSFFPRAPSQDRSLTQSFEPCKEHAEAVPQTDPTKGPVNRAIFGNTPSIPGVICPLGWTAITCVHVDIQANQRRLGRTVRGTHTRAYSGTRRTALDCFYGAGIACRAGRYRRVRRPSRCSRRQIVGKSK
jgi:hypothetical protein